MKEFSDAGTTHARQSPGAPSPRAAPLSTSPAPYLRWLLAAALVSVTLLMRSPTFNDHILFIDEPIYYSFGSRLELPGAHVYTHTVDQKPPLGPLTYWLAIKISGKHAIMVAHAFTTVAIAGTAVLMLAASNLFLGSLWLGFGAGLVYALIGSSKPMTGEALFAFSSLEHFQAPLLLGFMSLFLLSLQRQRVRVGIVAGVVLGIAALYKPNVLVLLASAWGVALYSAWRQRLPIRSAAAVGVASACSALAVFAAAPLYYASIGHFDAWRSYNIDALVLYGSLGGSVLHKAVLLAEIVPLKIPLAIGLAYGMVTTVRADRSHWAGEAGLFLVTTWLLLFCSLAPGLNKAHYLIQGLPAECLLIGMAAVAGWQYTLGARGAARPAFGTAYLAVLVVPLANGIYQRSLGWSTLAAYTRFDSYLALHREAGTLTPLVQYIEEHSGPDDLIYVHSEAPEFYFLTQRHPAASDPTGSWIAMVPSPKFADDLLRDLQTTPPKLIVELDYRRYGRAGETLEKWPQLASWIEQRYTVHTPLDHTWIFERNDASEKK